MNIREKVTAMKKRREMNQENNRNLTPAEETRRINFEIKKKALIDHGYEAKDLTIGLVYANVMAFVLAMPIIGCFAAVYMINNSEQFLEFSISIDANLYIKLAIAFIILFLLVVAHELIHGITWSMFTKKGWKSISFGFIAKYMTPYCTCDEALKKGQYIIGGLMPTIILGIFPAIVSVLTASLILFEISILMILLGGGDLTITMKLLMFRAQNKEVLCIDHPYRAGLVAFVK